MEAISRSCLPEAAARTKRQRKATCCGVLGAPSHRTTCARSSAHKLTSGLLLAMRTYIPYWPQYVYLFMIHTTSASGVPNASRLAALTKPKDPRRWKNQSVRCPVRNEQIQDRTLAGCPPLYRSDRMFPVIVSSSEGNRRHHVDGLRGFPDRDSHGWRHLRWIGWCLCGK